MRGYVTGITHEENVLVRLQRNQSAEEPGLEDALRDLNNLPDSGGT
jgi:hypothetical protein